MGATVTSPRYSNTESRVRIRTGIFLFGINWVSFIPLTVLALQFLKIVAGKLLAKSLSCKSRTAFVELLRNAVDFFDKIIIKCHLNCSHITPL